jgi:histidinol-phosphate/aromatic aminotransferase/cobyric acid decarboxylase-like protein
VAQEAGFKTFPSVGNFILAERAPSMPKIPELCQKLYDKGVVVRALKEFGLENHVRISVGTLEEIAQLAQVLKVIL